MNRLGRETSPYLLQHKDNPVDWYAWGDEAFARARAEGRPVLLSVGYSSCHWCHVMEHESFENERTAEIMNRHFVNVKVDREERPDVDALYMDAVVAMTGHGGWPMTVFLTPEGEPFFGGTYFPPEDRHGIPSFERVLLGVAQAYAERPGDVRQAAGQLVEAVRRSERMVPDAGPLDSALRAEAFERLRRQYDPVQGGFGGAPKFPPSALLPTLLASGETGAITMATRTLDRMAAGGIHDQLGGGFHRYAVDGYWLVPHFEKMLYDNALLADAYAAGYAATGDEAYRAVALDVCHYLEREMSLPEGGFASAQDADTEGHEGLTFVWTPAQIAEVVGEADAALVATLYGVTEAGNFEGSNVLSVVTTLEEAALAAGVPVDDAAERLAGARRRLLEARDRRPQPDRDDKALAAWNGLALAAFANAGRRLGRPELVTRAVRLADFLLGPMSRPDGGLFRTFRQGEAKIDGFADDYGAVADGLLALHAATGELRWLEEARRLTALALELFGDEEAGGFFLAPAGGEALVARTKDVDDNPAPSGNSLLASNLLRLGRIYGDHDWEERASGAVQLVRAALGRAPQAFGRLLGVLDALLAPPRELAVVGPVDDARTAALRGVLDGLLDLRSVVVVADPTAPAFAGVPLLTGKGLVDDGPAAYVCERFACRRPVTEPAELRALLGAG
jgi:hypothetical protein